MPNPSRNRPSTPFNNRIAVSRLRSSSHLHQKPILPSVVDASGICKDLVSAVNNGSQDVEACDHH